ncbi:MAG: tRNA (cytidine(56)-2'-O)-methyltransferase [Candidatus Nanohaloarchaea archaeon]|nr:tRNA (cytidine(56)-2'-O)-methyltransferase [Candidatus Nanohaloarchaea archaeon]
MIHVLRLGHRRGRDDRISSHVGLTARQLGAAKITYAGEKDDNMLQSIKDVSERWGGSMEIEYREDYRNIIRNFDGTSVHLTMYGRDFQQHLNTCRTDDLLVVVGSQKVPRDIYDMVDHNLAVGHQPHSEVAALGIFLYEVNSRDIPDDFEEATIEVIPSDTGKKTQELD